MCVGLVSWAGLVFGGVLLNRNEVWYATRTGEKVQNKKVSAINTSTKIDYSS